MHVRITKQIDLSATKKEWGEGGHLPYILLLVSLAVCPIKLMVQKHCAGKLEAVSLSMHVKTSPWLKKNRFKIFISSSTC